MNVSEITKIATGYAVAIADAWSEKNPEWADRDGFDVFFANIASLMAELSVEIDSTILMVALAPDWQTTCFKSENGWVGLAGEPVDECEVMGMVQAGAWMVFTDGTEWSAQLPSVH